MNVLEEEQLCTYRVNVAKRLNHLFICHVFKS